MPAFILLAYAALATNFVYTQFVEKDLCSSKCLCLPNERVVACHENDNMRAIPTNIDRSITRFIIQKGNFDSPKLYKHNLTGLEHLTFLKIIYYNLNFIGPMAFSGMKSLRYLDLSHNRLLNVESYGFTGLNLLELHIMENVNIRFKAQSFFNMTSESINLRSNNLSDLDYELFKNTKVKNFYLYNNRLKTINPKFQLLFNDFDSLLDVSNNPLTCDCSLSWLADTLAARFSNKEKLIHSKKINISCEKPAELFNRELRFLRPEDLKCSSLKIDSVRLHLESNQAQLTCVSEIGGSNPPKVTWLYYVSEFDKKVIPGSDSMELFKDEVFRTLSTTYNTINLTANLYRNGVSKLVCLSTIDSGVAQKLEIQIHQISTISHKSNNTISSTNIKSNILFTKHFSILEMIGAVLGTFSATSVSLIFVLRYLRSYQKKLINKGDVLDRHGHHRNINSIKPCWYVPHCNSSTYSMPNSHQYHPDYESPSTMDRVHDNITGIYSSLSYPTNRKSHFIDYKTHNPIAT